MATPRYLGTLLQGVDEEILYTITTTNWGSSPTSVAVVAKDISNSNADVSSTVLSGSSSVSGDVITTPVVKSLTVDHRYRIEVKFTAGGSVWEAYFLLDAET